MKTIIKNTIKIFAIAMTLFCFTGSLVSCSKSDDAAAEESGSSTFTCKIDGVNFVAISASGGDNSANTTPGVLRATTINARAADGNTMIFQLIEGNAKVGTITLDGTNGSIVNYGKDTNFSFASAGNLNITTFTSTRAKGTFQFTLNNQRDNPTVKKVVTEGVFDVPLQNGF
jgi:hypothetical protein